MKDITNNARSRDQLSMLHLITFVINDLDGEYYDTIYVTDHDIFVIDGEIEYTPISITFDKLTEDITMQTNTISIILDNINSALSQTALGYEWRNNASTIERLMFVPNEEVEDGETYDYGYGDNLGAYDFPQLNIGDITLKDRYTLFEGSIHGFSANESTLSGQVSTKFSFWQNPFPKRTFDQKEFVGVIGAMTETVYWGRAKPTNAAQSDIAPNSPTNFTASDARTDGILIDWDNSTIGHPLPTYDLYNDTSLVTAGVTRGEITTGWTDDLAYPNLRVKAVNSEGSAYSNTDSGTEISELVAPNAPTNFNATDDLGGKIIATWTNSTEGNPTPTYNLYEDDVEVVTGMTSGDDYEVGAGTRDYYIRAINAEGYANSSVDEGTSTIADPGSITYYANDTFVVPAGYTEVDICMIGGGGSGAVSRDTAVGGGNAGEIISQAVSVTQFQEIAVIIGAGGATRSSQSLNLDGYDGDPTSFGAITADGGIKGQVGDGYLGNGASSGTCMGTFRDGYAYASIVSGGQRGFANGSDADKGTVSPTPPAGSSGAGGGAAFSNFGEVMAVSGHGGQGVCKVSWGL